METKYCPKCQEELPISEFNKNRARKDGLSSYCKYHAKQALKKYLSNPENVQKAKQQKKDYEQSEAGKQRKKRYEQSKMGKQRKKEYLDRQKYKKD